MGIGAAQAHCLSLLLHRWRPCLFCIVGVAVFLSTLLLSGSSESIVSNPLHKMDAWLYLFLIRSRHSFSGMIQNNKTYLPPTQLQIRSPEEISERKRQVTDKQDRANSSQVEQRLDDPLSVPDKSPVIMDVRTPPTVSRSSSSYRDDENVLHHNVENSSSLCDLTVGRWVLDDSYPLYQPSLCPYVEDGFDCQTNGRPDSGYMRWKWRPKDCEIPRFSATNLLEKLRGKRMVFVGDSLNRNQWESMLCLLREAISNKSRMFETRGQRITKERGQYKFQILDYNCTVEFYRSHYLVAEEKQPIPGSAKLRHNLRLDTIDKNAGKWRGASVLVFTTGHWWNHGKTARGKNFFKEGDVVYGTLPVMVAFRKAMATWGSWLDQNVKPNFTKVYFCGYSPAHFLGAQSSPDDQCHKQRDPIFNESYTQGYPDKMLVLEETIVQMTTPVTLLNVTRFSEFRKDAHPSIYRKSLDEKARPSQDCSHWCLPGVPDLWNEVLYALLIMQG